MRPVSIAAAVVLATSTALAPLTAYAVSSTDRKGGQSQAGKHDSTGSPSAGRHVLVLSVDGLHESDLAWYVAAHPRSALAGLVHDGTSYSHASTTFPSDSFPGMVAQFTGAGPGTSGVYYDDTYSRARFAAGTTSCAGQTPGAEVAWTEAADRSHNPIQLDAGQGLPGLAQLSTNTVAQTLANAPALTTAILAMTPNPATLLDPAALPVSADTCTPILPHQDLRVNTVFEVAAAAGLRTAWSDKHPAYEILNGPSGKGINDLFTPEINSVASATGGDWTSDNALTQEYDSVKVAAVLNEIRGFDHSGTTKVGTPAIFGMNFQAVSTAQKLPTSGGQPGGYGSDGTPGPVLTKALDGIDVAVGALRAEIKKTQQEASTTIVVSAKHGQSPIDGAALRRVDDGAIIDAINAAWTAAHPGAKKLVAFSVDDDVMMLWLSDRSVAAQAFVKDYLMGHAAPANTLADAKGTTSASVSASGLTSLHTGADARALFGARSSDPDVPDVVGIVQHGVVYTSGVKKIAEHGGADAQDRHVPLVVAGAGTGQNGRRIDAPVQTTQVAPTILRLLSLDPGALAGVRAEHTKVLPGLPG